MAKRVFIDGEAGTTGLGIRERLARVPGVELVEVQSRYADPASASQMMAMGFQPPMIHDIRCKRTRRAPRIRLAAVPPEEFLIDPTARSLVEATYVGH